MSNVPLPCPFCGGAPNQQTDRVYWPKFRVFCDHGAEHAVFIGGDTQEAAIAAWNRRAHAAKDDEIERLRAEVAGLQIKADLFDLAVRKGLLSVHSELIVPRNHLRWSKP